MNTVTIDDLLETIGNLDIPFEVQEAIDETKQGIIDRQKDQLMHGQRADGSIIGKYKNPAYAKMKNALNPLPGFGVMDWKLKGDLYSALFVDVREDGSYIVDSADPKAGPLEERLGDPMGLQPKNQQQYIDEQLEPFFLERIHEATGL